MVKLVEVHVGTTSARRGEGFNRAFAPANERMQSGLSTTHSASDQ